MARKTSLWSELQRERKRRERAAQARDRAQQQMIRQLTRDQEQAERRAVRADVAERKRQEQLAHDAGAAAAKEMKAQLDARVTELRTLLASALPTPPQLPFSALKRAVHAPPFSPGDLGEPAPAPQWEDFAPPPPGMLSGLASPLTTSAPSPGPWKKSGPPPECWSPPHGSAQKPRPSPRATTGCGSSKAASSSTSSPSTST
jgi:hypothetical protein